MFTIDPNQSNMGVNFNISYFGVPLTATYDSIPLKGTFITQYDPNQCDLYRMRMDALSLNSDDDLAHEFEGDEGQTEDLYFDLEIKNITLTLTQAGDFSVLDATGVNLVGGHELTVEATIDFRIWTELFGVDITVLDGERDLTHTATQVFNYQTAPFENVYGGANITGTFNTQQIISQDMGSGLMLSFAPTFNVVGNAIAPGATADEVFGQFVDLQYIDFLDRFSEPSGHDFYVGNLEHESMSLEQVVRNFIASPEFTDYNGFIARCYFAIFNNNSLVAYDDPGYRIPDYGGMVYWAAEMQAIIAAGGSMAEAQGWVVRGFTNSPEWQSRIGTLNDSEFVYFLYEYILGRDAETAGYNYHFSRLQNGWVSRDEMVQEFIISAEAQFSYQHHTYVAMAYLGLLDRGADKGGFNYHMQRLLAGEVDVVAFLRGFIYAPEYVDRLTFLNIRWPSL